MSVARNRDSHVQSTVQDELEWIPDVNAAKIGIAVNDGAVSLSGEVASYSERVAAVRAALRVRGVNSVADDITVHPRASWPAAETDIAKEVERALASASNVPDTVKAEIEGHSVVLSGPVMWDYQRQAAKRAVQRLRGVLSVTDHIFLTARASAVDTAKRIRDALTRNALVDANDIDVTASGNLVTLAGIVRSWAEKEQAGRAAWASPNVTDVDNRIMVWTDRRKIES
jgi:osmotically-inducible protein OsmY